MSIKALSKVLRKTSKYLGDANAVRHGNAGSRAGRRAAGKATRRAARKASE